MDSYKCSNCGITGELLCYCNQSSYCVGCIGKHLVLNPSTMHKTIPLQDLKMRSLLASSMTQIKAKESEIIMHASSILALENMARNRIQQEISTISKFCENSILKIQNFVQTLKTEIDQASKDLISNVQKICDDYKESLQNDSVLLENLKLQGSAEMIQKFEITSSICTVSGINIKQLMNESLYFELGLQANDLSNRPSFGLSSISVPDVSMSLDSQLWKRTRTRVPTKVMKKSQTFHLFASDYKKLIIFNNLTKDKDSINLNIDCQSVCSLTTDGNLFITGGSNSKNCFIFDINDKKIEQVQDMSTVRAHHAAVSLGDFVYVIGGLTAQGVTGTCERFDLMQKTWQSIGDLIHPREKHSACVYRGRIFVAGGVQINTLEVFNTVSNKFSTLRTILPMPGPCLMFPVEDFMIIFHGNNISSFDPAKFTCQSLTSLAEDDWYITGNVILTQKTASFLKQEEVFCFDVESGEFRQGHLSLLKY